MRRVAICAGRHARAVAAVSMMVFAPFLVACGGGGGGSSSSSSSGSSSGSSSSTSMTLSTMDDSYKLEIVNASTGNVLTITDSDQSAGADITTASSDDTDVQRWHVMPMGSSEYNVENMLTHQVMGVENASTSTAAAIVQWADNGTDDHLWKFYLLSDGNYVIKNVNSSYYLTSDGAGGLTQEARDTSSTLQEWTITVSSDLAYPLPMTVSGDGIYVHDPDMIRVDGTYYVYATHNNMATSSDMSTFDIVDDGIFDTDFDWWADKNTTGTDGRTDLWAPSLKVSDGTYYQYYSIPIYEDPSDSSSNEGAEAIIALATSTSPDGPWTDAANIVASCGDLDGCETEFNAIDPAPYEDTAGNWYLSFGSWEDGIHVFSLDSSTGERASVTDDSDEDQLNSSDDFTDIAARTAGEEGSFIFPYAIDGTQYYFYFASINVCCSGTSSTYRIIVGRATSPTGPFYDRGGQLLTDSGGTILLSSHGDIYGPGGQSVREFDSQPYLIYHYYDGANSGIDTLGINKLEFDSDGWPYVAE